MKSYENNLVTFQCDGCGKTLSMNISEEEALKEARENAKELGWIWKHPHWQLYCTKCKHIEFA